MAKTKVLRSKIPQRRDVFYLRDDNETESYFSFSDNATAFSKSWLKKQSREFMPRPDGAIHHLIFDSLYLVASSKAFEKAGGFKYIAIEDFVDHPKNPVVFGPVVLGSIHRFCGILAKEIDSNLGIPIVLENRSDSVGFTNIVFLLGSFMLLKLGSNLEEVISCFKFAERLCTPYGDATSDSFELHLRDCWGGLKRAINLGWFFPGDTHFDLAEYEHFASPLNADLHEIIPGKLIAFRSPKEMPDGVSFRDVGREDRFCHRDFSPEHYIDALQQFDVKAVVRLNQPEYKREALLAAGIAVADLYFPDCCCPPPDVVAKFMMIAEAVGGPIAVHCEAGLGRTGTMAALYMMTHHGFSAREAMGWLRVVRPGSVLGAQQRYLCEREAVMRRMGAAAAQPGPAQPGGPAGVEEVMRVIEETVATVDQRMEALARRQRQDRRNSAP